MSGARLVVAVLSAVVLGAAGLGHALDCEGRLVTMGASPWDVQALCGDPAQVRDTMEVVLKPVYDPQGRVAVTADLEPVPWRLAQAMAGGLILNELLTNALTHAFPEDRAGLVISELRATSDGAVVLRVTDTGVGVPAGLDIHQPTRLGWQLVTVLTRQLQGELTLERDPCTCITVQWPR
jgi:two-component sensor histidine kinase